MTRGSRASARGGNLGDRPNNVLGPGTQALTASVCFPPRSAALAHSSRLGWRAQCHTGCSTRRAGPRRGVPPCSARRSPSRPAGRWPPASVGAPAPLRRPPTFSAATISPPPTRRAASIARWTRLLLSSDLFRLTGWSCSGLCLASSLPVVVVGLRVFMCTSPSERAQAGEEPPNGWAGCSHCAVPTRLGWSTLQV